MEIPSPEVQPRKRPKISVKLFSIILFFVIVSVFIIVLCIFWSKTNLKPRELLVQTKLGAIRGHYLKSYNGNEYEAYEGIPYAQPPIGRRRFQSPIPMEPWSNAMQATKVKSKCLQNMIDQPDASPFGTEDCLYLNIYVSKKIKTNESLPVIFYIHGGAFRYGGIREDEQHYLMDNDIIFVPIQYRLGAFGFLSTEDHVVPGNMGLKDQSMALRWIYENIEAFGGDPKRITLFGVSAGAASVQLHYLSVWSRGLFNAGISLSGTALNPWAIVENSRDKAITLAHEVECNQEDIEKMVECMRLIPEDILVAAENKLQAWFTVNYGVFGPVVEHVSSSVDPFICDYPSRILKEGQAYDVPWITGFVSEEGLLATAAYNNDTFKYLDENWDFLAPKILDFTYSISKDQHVNVSRRIRKHYLAEKPINRENIQELTQMITDRLFVTGAVNAIKLQATVNKSPVFLYYYSYRATDSNTNVLANSTENLGVSHGDDIHLVIKNPSMTPTKSEKDMAMQRLLMNIWISVAYNGVPDIGVKWPNVNLKNTACLDYMHLAGPGNFKSECSNMLAEKKFWKSINFNEK